MPARIPKSLLCVACVGMLITGTTLATAETPCLQAVFFDLGDTLVENPGGGVYVLRPGAAQTIIDLQGIGVRLGIITNVPAGWTIDDLRAILAEPEFLDEFEVVILSSQAPAPKPDPAIYTFAHASLPAPRPPITATAFVGETLGEIADREIDPTEGARSVGMVGIHLSDLPPSPLADFTIPRDELDQVVMIVEDSCTPSGVDDRPAGPRARLLHLPRPNPSNGNTRIEFSLSTDEQVRIGVFDVQGRRVAILVDRHVSAGRHEVLWDGADADGVRVPSGIYYWRMQAGNELQQARVLRLR